MKDKMIVGFVSAGFGVGFLFAAYYFAAAAFSAPSGSRGDPSMLEVTAAIPAFFFTIAGTAGVIAGAVLILTFAIEKAKG